MAGGNLSPRQKMINLMYLVFIAMLAMNMSKQVLSAFGFMKEKLAASNIRVADANANILKNLSDKAADNPGRYAKKYQDAMKINAVSNDFFNYIGEIKSTLTKNVKDPNDYESMDTDEVGDNYFFGENDKNSAKGQEFVDKINNYKKEVIKLAGDSIGKSLVEQINKRFSTEDQKAKDGKAMLPWLYSRYKGFPLITTITNLEQMQADIRTTESEVFNSMLGGALIDETSMNNYEAIVALDKTAFFAGEKVSGKIVLGKYDRNMTIVNYNSNVGGTPEAGQVNLNFSAGNPGVHPIKGQFQFKQNNGSTITLPFESEYTVITEPNQAVISAEKMNVVYRGLNNPLSISVPGVGDNNLTVSAPGLSKVGSGQYVVTPTSGNELVINVSAKLSSGKVINTKKVFRIKNVPPPTGAIRGQTQKVSMPKESIANATVGVVLPDFVFDLTFEVTGFTIKVPGQPSAVVNGARMNAAAQSAIAKAQKGEIISIFDIKSRVVGEGAGLPVQTASPVTIDVK